MWQSLHHEENTMLISVNVMLPAAPNMRCWVNSLASSYLVRLSLLSSSLFSVLFWASDAAILLSRFRFRLCSEEVTTVQCRLTCSHNGEPNLLRVSDWITVQLFCLCKIAQSLTQWIKRDTSEGTTEATTCTDGGCAWKVLSILVQVHWNHSTMTLHA